MVQLIYICIKYRKADMGNIYKYITAKPCDFMDFFYIQTYRLDFFLDIWMNDRGK